MRDFQSFATGVSNENKMISAKLLTNANKESTKERKLAVLAEKKSQEVFA